MAKNLDENKRIALIEEEIIIYSRQHGESIKNGNHRAANKAFDKITKLRKKLYQLGESRYVTSLLKLLAVDDIYVKKFASSYLLPFEEEIARKELEELQQLPGLFGFSAEMVLKEWDKGRLNLIPK